MRRPEPGKGRPSTIRSLIGAACIIMAFPVHAIESASPGAGRAADSIDIRTRIRNLRPPEAKMLKARCCKTCKKGVACGDSCISATKRCHKAPGCACDG